MSKTSTPRIKQEAQELLTEVEKLAENIRSTKDIFKNINDAFEILKQLQGNNQ